MEEKTEELKEELQQQDNNTDTQKNLNREQQRLYLAAQAYKLFSDRKTPLEVAIALNLRESEATKFYKEYWKIKQLHNLNMVYEETRGDIEPLLKLYKLSKAKGMRVQQVVDVLAIANNDLPVIEERFERLRNDVSMLQSQKHICKRNLYQLNNQIATTTRLLSSLRMSCEKERRDIENLYNEKVRLEDIVTEFKSNNEEYIKIKQVSEENVKSVLTNGKILLRFAAASVIESLNRNSELCNFVLNDILDDTTYGSNCRSLMLPRQEQQQSFSYISDDICTAVILEEAENLYNELTTKLTNSVIAAAADIRASSLPPAGNNRQELTHKNDETGEPKYNNNLLTNDGSISNTGFREGV